MNIPNWLKQRAFLTPERTALVFEQTSWTFAELYNETLKTASALRGSGIQKGGFCGILAGNRPETIFTIYALQQIGAVAILLNSRLTADEIEWQLHDAGASHLLFDAHHEQKAAAISSVPSLSIVENTVDRLFNPRDIYSLDETCSIMYTSGTTGRPKGVIQTYGNHYASATGSAFNLGIHSDDSWLCAVPLFHISGYSILMKSVIYGMEIHLFEKFDVAGVNKALKSGDVTIMSVVTAMLSVMVNELTGKYSPRFRCMLLGGGPAPAPLLEECRKNDIPVFQTYGMTETSSQIVTLSPEYALTKLGSAGKPLFPCTIKIDGENEGEILVSGPNVTPGYLHRPEANEQAFQNGWFHTGDIGRIDEAGFLYVLDRRSDLIISGGENIYPAEIESVLTEHEAVKEAGVIGVPDKKWGSVPAAFYVTERPLSSDELAAFCRGKLARYKVPAYFIQVEELPRNASNKLLRRELGAKWRDDHAHKKIDDASN
ncbi:o-succinylbenzoate--CoA ligase [Domibacillus epiphyticus]|uniref:2-succinylbenzoate--CoA ligase n=1 Tax=Domibacillus epiphyticus TaxID=1714355 RepID=A0A1V2A8S6_9BACI|nr:o-succinylbenzoate--CoA ligase [Domibacillus epiphyticus]OMP67393.1 o-succinylbenzoate--CoA ligase [Domibacillus epiphyticus]